MIFISSLKERKINETEILKIPPAAICGRALFKQDQN